MFDDIEHGYKMLNDPEVRARMATWGADKGVEMLTPCLYSPLMLLTHKGVRAVADFQGQKCAPRAARRCRSSRSRRSASFRCRCRSARRCRRCRTRPSTAWSAAANPFVVFKYYDIAKPMTYLPATMFAAPMMVNKALAEIARSGSGKDRARRIGKAEKLFLDWNIADIKRNEDLWRKNGGEIITMPQAEAKKYADLVTPVAASIVAGNPRVKADYDFLIAAAKKYRQ